MARQATVCGLSGSTWEKQEGGIEETSAFLSGLCICLYVDVAPCHLAVERLASVA